MTYIPHPEDITKVKLLFLFNANQHQILVKKNNYTLPWHLIDWHWKSK